MQSIPYVLFFLSEITEVDNMCLLFLLGYGNDSLWYSISSLLQSQSFTIPSFFAVIILLRVVILNAEQYYNPQRAWLYTPDFKAVLPHGLHVQTNTAHISNVPPQESGIFLTLPISSSLKVKK